MLFETEFFYKHLAVVDGKLTLFFVCSLVSRTVRRITRKFCRLNFISVYLL